MLQVPVVLLLFASVRASEKTQLTLWLGTGFQTLISGFVLVCSHRWRQSGTPLFVTLYLIGLSWLWVGTRASADWYSQLAQAILLMGAVIGYGRQILKTSGALALRRAHRLADRLAARQDLMADVESCRNVSTVKALRTALQIDASPALALLNHPRVGVRVAALCALEFRHAWRRGQAEMVLQFAQRAQDPAERAAAVLALGNVHDRVLIEGLAEFLNDSAWDVRRAATEALLWNAERRWAWIRPAVRRALGNPSFQNDGPLQPTSQSFTAEVVGDLIAWTAEKGILSARAASTLVIYYGKLLNEHPDAALVEDLRQRLLNVQTPPVLRVELARLLHSNRALERDVLEKLLLPANPAPLRLLAVEAILAEKDHPDLAAVLRDLARLPNREIALATAVVVQRHLGVDLGINLAEALPPLHSRQAADITRRVMKWAAQYEVAVE
jgi:hypothetical protein